MPVTKYRSAFDMNRPARVSGDPGPHIRTVLARAFTLYAPTPRRGVQRFRSIEAANAAREHETAQRMKLSR